MPKKTGATERRFEKSKVENTRDIFHAVFPLAFAGRGAQKQPLKIKIDKDLAAHFPDIDRHLLKAALHNYVSGPKYLENVLTGASRVDLNGAFAGVVTSGHEEYAKSRLAQLKKKWAAKRAPKKVTA